MSVIYGGTSSFTLQRRDPRSPAGEMPSIVETWRGAQPQRDAFIALYPSGFAYGGGYVTDTQGRDDGPWSDVEITIGLQPDCNSYWPVNSTGIKTSTISATVQDGSIIEGEDSVKATRTVSFYSPETSYAYFASQMPNGPRYGKVANTAQPEFIRSVITASAGSTTLTFSGEDAPAALVVALYMPVYDQVVSHNAQIIKGTPWFTCVDTVARIFLGDSA